MKPEKPTKAELIAEMEMLLAENAELRKDSARWQYVKDHAEWFRFKEYEEDKHCMMSIRLPCDTDLSCKATREAAIDTSIAAAKWK